MIGSRGGTQSVSEWVSEVFRVDDKLGDGPRFVVAVLALVAAVLVAVSVQSALQTGHAAVAGSLLGPVGLFVGAIAVFEVGFRIGADGNSP